MEKREIIQRLEAARCEFEAMLTVLSARVGGANDNEDWRTLMNQSWDLYKVAARALAEAKKL